MHKDIEPLLLLLRAIPAKQEEIVVCPQLNKGVCQVTWCNRQDENNRKIFNTIKVNAINVFVFLE
jgi:hypothetical protein